MKRDPFFSQQSRRSARVASALMVAALSGMIGASIDWGPLDPALRALDTSRALLQNRATAPDHSLLSASDIERALPVPSRTEGLTISTAS